MILPVVRMRSLCFLKSGTDHQERLAFLSCHYQVQRSIVELKQNQDYYYTKMKTYGMNSRYIAHQFLALVED